MLAEAKLSSIFGSEPPDNERKEGSRVNSKCSVSSMLNFLTPSRLLTPSAIERLRHQR